MSLAVKRAGALLAGLVLLAIPAVAWGQGPMIPSPAASADLNQGLLVHGHAEVKALPDVAYITFGVVTQSKQSASAASENAARSQAVIAALKAAGVADRDIQSLGYTIDPQYSNGNGPTTVTGFQATNTVRVTVHSLPKIGSVIDAAVKAGANNVNDLTFDLSDRHHVEGEALVAAIANARSKADLMAGAAGITLGSILRLSEDNAPIVQPIFARMALSMGPNQVAGPTPVSPQEITVTADVTAVYGILPY